MNKPKPEILSPQATATTVIENDLIRKLYWDFCHWLHMPRRLDHCVVPLVELPISFYSESSRMVEYLVDSYGDRAVEELWRRYELAELANGESEEAYWIECLNGMAKYGKNYLDLPAGPVLTPEETAETLIHYYGVFGAQNRVADQEFTYRQVALDLEARGVSGKATTQYWHWYKVLGLVHGLNLPEFVPSDSTRKGL